MTDPAVLRIDQQRKEVRERSNTMFIKRKREEDDQVRSRRKRAVIYLRELDSSEVNQIKVPSIETQRRICHRWAKDLHVEVVDEFVDMAGTSLPLPGLEQLWYRLYERPRPDFLIVYSMDRLVPERDGAFHIGRALGSTGTILFSWAYAYESELKQKIAD
jgi:hypothetical protein